jgi:putative resolvase
VVGIQAEVAAGLPGQRRLLADPKVTAMVVEHRDQLARMNVDLIQAALAADGCPLVAGR